MLPDCEQPKTNETVSDLRQSWDVGISIPRRSGKEACQVGEAGSPLAGCRYSDRAGKGRSRLIAPTSKNIRHAAAAWLTSFRRATCAAAENPRAEAPHPPIIARRLVAILGLSRRCRIGHPGWRRKPLLRLFEADVDFYPRCSQRSQHLLEGSTAVAPAGGQRRRCRRDRNYRVASVLRYEP
jgi:hypothetical protein